MSGFAGFEQLPEKAVMGKSLVYESKDGMVIIRCQQEAKG